MGYYVKGYMPPAYVKSKADVKMIQRQIGVKDDGVWGPKTWRAHEASIEDMDFTTPLIERTKAYVKKYRADYYIVQAMKKVERARLDGKLPDGTDLVVEFAAQFDGVPHELFDHIDNAEYRIPYADGVKFKWADCSSWTQSLYLLFYRINIGTWTEGQWKWGEDKRVDINELRSGDLVFWNFKRNRNVSHTALYLGKGYIQHTTSKKRPLRIEKLKGYAYNKIVGCIRPVSDELYKSRIVVNNTAPVAQPEFRELKLMNPMMKGDDIGELQGRLNVEGFPCGKADRVFGPKTKKGVIAYKQSLVDGVVTKDVWDRLFS